jgi:hypothetical protein
MRGLIVWGILFVSIAAYSQQKSNCAKSNADTVFPSFRFLSGSSQFAPSVKIASGAFYELADVKISVKRKNIKTMMAARPKANFLFKPKARREYVIIVSNRPELNADALYEQMSLCAKVGVIGHELSHILSYSEMSGLEMLWFGIKYVFKKKEIEHETDLIAIRKGFGEQIVEFNHYIYHSPKTNKDICG